MFSFITGVSAHESDLKQSFSMSTSKADLEKLIEDITTKLGQFEEELLLNPRVDKWILPEMFSGVDINLGVVLYHLHQIGVLRHILSDKPALQEFWKSFMERPKTQEICLQGNNNRDDSAKVDSEGSRIDNSLEEISFDSSSIDEEVSQVFKQETETTNTHGESKERKKLRRKKQHEERSWYSLW